MLCPLPAGKPASTSTSTSTSNWLDRLRSNKGFPIADNLGLDHFLSNQILDNPDSTRPNPLSDSHSHSHSHPNFQRREPDNSSNSPTPTQNANPGPYGIITGILSDLFNMNAASPNSKCSAKKFPRKQSNPKICSIPSLNNADYTDDKNPCCPHKEDNILSSNSDNSSKGGANGGSGKGQNARGKVEEEEVEDEKGEKELIGYSKSEVTVIDTSCDLWKSDKLIFRRKNVWKVKDKKGKLRNYGRKKRKQSSDTNDLPDMIALASKKTKVWGSEERFHFNAQQIRGRESLKSLNKGYNPQHCSGPEISANTPDSSNDKKENVYTLSQGNGSYDPEKSDHPRA